MVVDAVEDFNSNWEIAIDEKVQRLEMERLEQEKSLRQLNATKFINGKLVQEDPLAALVDHSKQSLFLSEAEKRTERQVMQKIEMIRSEVELDPEVRQELAERTLLSLTRDLLTLAGIDPSVRLSELSTLLDKWHEEDMETYESLKKNIQMHITHHMTNGDPADQSIPKLIDSERGLISKTVPDVVDQGPSKPSVEQQRRKKSIYDFPNSTEPRDNLSQIPGDRIKTTVSPIKRVSTLVNNNGIITNEYAVELLYIIRSVDSMN